MTERNRWDSKRRSPLSDPRRGTSSSGSSRGSHDRDRDRDRDYRRERDYRHEKDRDKDKKDRYHDHHNHRKHSNERHRSGSRDRSSDSSSSHKTSRHDDHRGSSHDHRSSSSHHHKSSYNHKHRDSPSNSNYSSSPYSTPPPAPPAPPPAPPSPHYGQQVQQHVLPGQHSQVAAPVSHLASHSTLHSAMHPNMYPGNHGNHSLYSGAPGVQSQGPPSHPLGHSSSVTQPVSNLSHQYQLPSNMYVDHSVGNSQNRPDPRLPERRTSDPRRNVVQNSVPVVEEVKKNFKLLIDPAIKKGHAKVIRYDGILTGQPPVIPKDPRRIKSKIWSIDTCDLPVPEYKVDKNYVGPMPTNCIRFDGLNDNVNRKFLYELCEAYGDIKEYKVYFDPKTNKHTGTGKVIFDEKTRTDKIVSALNNRQVMGNVIKVWIDVKKPPGLPILKQLQLECLKARQSLPGFMHNIPMKGHHMKSQMGTTPPPNVSNMNRNHSVPASYTHSQSRYSTVDSNSGGYYRNTPPPPPHLGSTPPPPPPKLNYEDISPTGGEPDRKIYNNGQFASYKSNKLDKSALSLAINRTKSTSYNSVSNSERGISPISPAVKEHTPTEKKFPSYESISDSEHAPHVEDISPAGTPLFETDQNAVKMKVDDDDAMSLSSISSNEDSKVELNVSSQFLSQTSQTPNIQPGMIPNSSQLSTNQTVMNYISSAPLQHVFPSALHPPPRPPPQPHPPPQHAPPQSHPSPQTHPSLQQLPQPPSHLRPPPRPQPPLQPQPPPPRPQPPSAPHPHSYQHPPPQTRPPPQTHLPPPPQRPPLQQHGPPQHPQHPSQPRPPPQHPPPQHPGSQNRPPNQSNMLNYLSVASSQYNSRVLYQQSLYNSRNASTPAVLQTTNTRSINRPDIKNIQANSNSKTNYLIRPPIPSSINEKHADILRNALYGSNVSVSSISATSVPINYNPNRPPPPVPPGPYLIQRPMVPKELPFSFQVKSGCARDLSMELKRILAKDTLKKLVEQSAFACFETWWEKQRTSSSDIDSTNKIVKLDSNSTRKLLSDKTTNIVSYSNSNQPLKESTNTTSALLQTLFRSDKNNENRPPPTTTTSKFLNSYRISRKQEGQPHMKVSHISRKRRPWPALNQSKRKLPRLEDSEDEEMEDDEEEIADDEEDNQFEQFAMRQRLKQKSGSSLYQKIYSDESDIEDEDDVKGTQTLSEDEEGGKAEVISSSSSSESSESSASSSSSESEMSESETEEEIEQEPEPTKEEEKPSNEDQEQKKEVDRLPSPVPVPAKISKEKTPSPPESETEEEVTEADDEKEPDDEDIEEDEDRREKGVNFRSMYDEPRRRAVQIAERQMRELNAKLKGKKVSNDKDLSDSESSDDGEESAKSSVEEVIEKQPKVVIEKPDDVLLSSTEQTIIEEEEESVVEEDSTPEDEPSTPLNDEVMEEDQPVKQVEEETNDDDLISSFIMLEHSYFFKSPTSDDKIESKVEPQINKAEKYIAKELDSLLDSKNLYMKDLKHRFSMRSNFDETKLIWDITKEGVDAEDLDYLKEAFESLVHIGAKEVENLCWADHPITIIHPPKPKRGKGEIKLRVHKSGSARTEGYYKIPISEKAQYLKSALKQLNVMQRRDLETNSANAPVASVSVHHKMKSRENRAMQRRLASSIAQEEYGSLINYNQTLKMRKRALKFARSHIHNWGLFACEPIAAEEFVCEYIGQMIRSIVAELREQRYEKQGIGSSYLFRLDMDGVIDATKTGCNARFVNHSCQPNCYAKVILVEGQKKIVIYSKRDIKIGEEITYDYKFPIEEDKIPCMCGAPQCRGSLN